jgi:hypothetical protein
MREPTMKKLLAFLGLTLLLLVAGAATANSVWIWRTGTRLEEKLEAVRAAGDPVTLPDLGRPDSPRDDNAATRDDNAGTPLDRARDDLQAMTRELNPLRDGEDYQAGKLTDADHKKLKSLVDAYPKVFQLLEEAGNCSTYDPQLDFTATPDAVTTAALGNGTDFRAAFNALEARSRLQLGEGHRHEALQTGLLIFRLSRLYDGCLFLVNNLVANAGRGVAVSVCNRVLRDGPVTDKDRDALEAELARHDNHQGLIRSLKHERTLGIASYAGMTNWFNRALFNKNEARYLELAQEQIDLAPRPYGDFVKAVQNFKATDDKSAPLASLWVPAAHKTREAVERVRGVVRCLRVLNALQRAGVKPADGEPKLSALKLPAEATMDPFTDEPLHLKVVKGDWLIYTVGPDLTDDGGDLGQGKDFGVGPVPPVGK